MSDFHIARPQTIGDIQLDQRKQDFFDLVGYEPFAPWQRLFHAATDRFRFVHAGSGARLGKSKMGGMEAAFRTALVPDHRTWLVGENYDACRKEFEYAYDCLTATLPAALGKNVVTKAHFQPKSGNMEIRLGNGSWIIGKTAENLNSLLSEELDLIVLCEGSNIPPAAWERRLDQRIITRLGQVVIPTTAAGMTWMHDEFFVPALTDMAPAGLGYKPVAGFSHTAPSDWWNRLDPSEEDRWSKSYFTEIIPACDSPYYPKVEFERLLSKAQKSGEWSDFHEQTLGLFVQRTGLVIKHLGNALRTNKQLERDFDFTDGEPPSSWTRIVSMDYGDTTPKATMLGAIHPRWAVVVWYDEFYEKGRTIKDQVQWAKDRLGHHADSQHTTWIVDRAAPITEYIEAGAPVGKSMNLPGTRDWLEETSDRLFRELRMLVASERCKNFQWEAARLVRKPQTDKQYGDTVDRRVKKDDHLCDCVFYAGGWLAPQLIGEVTEPPPPAPPAWPPPMPVPGGPEKPQSMDDLVREILGGHRSGGLPD